VPQYPLIADHGLIGDLQTAALVATDGTIDWFCAPRFDSPSIFGSLLDHERGGRFAVRPAGAAEVTHKQLYHSDTAILITRFLTEAGVGEVIDFMPIDHPGIAHDEHRLVRMLRCVRGKASFNIEVAPRFDYGRAPHEVHLTENGAVFESAHTAMTVHLVRELDDDRAARITERVCGTNR
jgi:GH15 family glucan-1,4-alpha-glucosidase